MNKLISLTFFFIFLCPLLSAEICNIKVRGKEFQRGPVRRQVLSVVESVSKVLESLEIRFTNI